MLKINEMFFSIQGESSLVGWPTFFIRTSGCHLRCTYCDTQYAYYKGEDLSLDHILKKVAQSKTKFVCLTGGEPLLQQDSYPLMTQLCDLNYKVSLETSGDKSCALVDPRVRLIIDIKTPDSGEPDKYHLDNLTLTNPLIEYKFVICSEKDFYWAEDFIKQNNLLDYPVFYSPSFKEMPLRKLAELILNSSSPARLQAQLHKMIWPDEESGV